MVKKDGAKELNRAINVLGSKSDPSTIIKKLTEKLYKKEMEEETEKATALKISKQNEYEESAKWWLLWWLGSSGVFGLLLILGFLL